MGKEFNYLCHLSLEKDRKCKCIFMIPKNNFSVAKVEFQDVLFLFITGGCCDIPILGHVTKGRATETSLWWDQNNRRQLVPLARSGKKTMLIYGRTVLEQIFSKSYQNSTAFNKDTISIVQCKTVLYLLLIHWRYPSLVLSHWYALGLFFAGEWLKSILWHDISGWSKRLWLILDCFTVSLCSHDIRL